jgi:squalene-hopene/tetraprenyl-beta-curcumene cyclase
MSVVVNLARCAALAPCLLLAVVACSRSEPEVSRASAWDPAGAAAYLDRRINWWMSWRISARDHGTFCVSCHTAVPYALARANLAGTLGDSATSPERRLLQDVRTRVRLWSETSPYYTDQDSGRGKSEQARGTESVLNALILAFEDSHGGHLTADSRAAFANMWTLQHHDGDDAGAWSWLDFDLAPWEVADARYYGAALAALAVGVAPDDYRASPQIQDQLALLRDYLARNYPTQSLHHRLLLLWAASTLPQILSAEKKAGLIEEVLHAQNADGGWSLSKLALTAANRDELLRDPASDGYATGLATLALECTPMPATAGAVERGLAWLARNQHGHLGVWMRGKERFWVAHSLNTRRNPWSNVGRFMADAATGYAVLALSEAPAATHLAQR